MKNIDAKHEAAVEMYRALNRHFTVVMPERTTSKQIAGAVKAIYNKLSKAGLVGDGLAFWNMYHAAKFCDGVVGSTMATFNREHAK